MQIIKFIFKIIGLHFIHKWFHKYYRDKHYKKNHEKIIKLNNEISPKKKDKNIKSDIILLGKGYKWELFRELEKSKELMFKKDNNTITIWHSTMTVRTVINHPKQGKTQLFRKNCTINDIREIFKNPRVHTGKGYYNQNTQCK